MKNMNDNQTKTFMNGIVHLMKKNDQSVFSPYTEKAIHLSKLLLKNYQKKKVSDYNQMFQKEEILSLVDDYFFNVKPSYEKKLKKNYIEGSCFSLHYVGKRLACLERNESYYLEGIDDIIIYGDKSIRSAFLFVHEFTHYLCGESKSNLNEFSEELFPQLSELEFQTFLLQNRSFNKKDIFNFGIERLNIIYSIAQRLIIYDTIYKHDKENMSELQKICMEYGISKKVFYDNIRDYMKHENYSFLLYEKYLVGYFYACLFHFDMEMEASHKQRYVEGIEYYKAHKRMKILQDYSYPKLCLNSYDYKKEEYGLFEEALNYQIKTLSRKGREYDKKRISND